MSSLLHILLIMVVLMLGGCATITPQTPEVPQVSSVFVEETESQWPVQWWTTFNDSQLNMLVEQALTENYSLQAAASRVEQGLAAFVGQKSSELPSLSANFGKTRNWQESSASNMWSAGLSASYEIDLWGSIGALTDQAGFNIDASHAAYRTLANTVAAQVTTAWLGLRKENENLDLLEAQKTRVETALQIIERRQEKGVTVLTDVLQQQQLLQSIETDILASQAQLEIFKQQVALWSGKGESIIEPDKTDYLPTTASFSTPTVSLTALKARPDVQQAFYQLQSANAGLAAAASNRYPRFSLSASYNGQSPRLEDIFTNWAASLAGSIVAPIIDGGQRKQEQIRQESVVQESVLNYQQVILDAAQEVQESLVRNAQFQQTQSRIETQLGLAQTALDLSHRYYELGKTEYITLLNAQRDVLNLEQGLLNARWNEIQGRIQLFKAVSHGYFSDE